MNLLKLILLTIVLASVSKNAFSNEKDIVVVVHKNNPTTEMTRSQVIDLYMGKYVAFPNGSKAIPLDIEEGILLKQNFYLSLVNMPLARVNSYWSRIKFTGRARPPQKQADEMAMIAYVSGSTDAIAYISRSNLNDNLKVVFEFNE